MSISDIGCFVAVGADGSEGGGFVLCKVRTRSGILNSAQFFGGKSSGILHSPHCFGGKRSGTMHFLAGRDSHN